jgi:hypothetical protein
VSNINYASINENFPVAGQDNDTQVFRDNFDTIKTSFQEAKTEIEDLQANTARTDQDSDFNGTIITNAVLQNVYEKKLNGGGDTLALPAKVEVDFQNGSYQIFRFQGNTEIEDQEDEDSAKFDRFKTDCNPVGMLRT